MVPLQVTVSWRAKQKSNDTRYIFSVQYIFSMSRSIYTIIMSALISEEISRWLPAWFLVLIPSIISDASSSDHHARIKMERKERDLNMQEMYQIWDIKSFAQRDRIPEIDSARGSKSDSSSSRSFAFQTQSALEHRITIPVTNVVKLSNSLWRNRARARAKRTRRVQTLSDSQPIIARASHYNYTRRTLGTIKYTRYVLAIFAGRILKQGFRPLRCGRN